LNTPTTRNHSGFRVACQHPQLPLTGGYRAPADKAFTNGVRML
jgi:hypothetical protein